MKPSWPLILVLGLAACQSGDQESGIKPVNRFTIAQSACDFKRTIPNSITAVQTITGSVVYGDATNQALNQLPTVWSAVYATERDIVIRDDSGPGFCCQWYGPNYYCGAQYCKRSIEEDVSGLYGIGRAQTQSKAEELAEQNCEKVVDQYLASIGRRYLRGMRCEPLAVQECF